MPSFGKSKETSYRAIISKAPSQKMLDMCSCTQIHGGNKRRDRSYLLLLVSECAFLFFFFFALLLRAAYHTRTPLPPPRSHSYLGSSISFHCPSSELVCCCLCAIELSSRAAMCPADARVCSSTCGLPWQLGLLGVRPPACMSACLICAASSA